MKARLHHPDVAQAGDLVETGRAFDHGDVALRTGIFIALVVRELDFCPPRLTDRDLANQQSDK
ncbi:hypothetical protein LFL97_20340 [Burkholderia sp. JSH-S8]|nr:hypothetical protein LFL97_20340 [Burkholderia sp. JSH-S8]